MAECTLPYAGRAVVERVITALGVLDVSADGLVLAERAPTTTVADLLGRTGCPVLVPEARHEV